MDPSENRIRQIVLQRLTLCRVCHRQHESEDVHVISQNPDVWMMVVECPDCHTRSFVAAVVDEEQADQAKVALRRLAGEQELRIRESTDPQESAAEPAEPVSEDDVESMREYLQTFNGDFKSLFAKG
jgi:hypothetical protein